MRPSAEAARLCRHFHAVVAHALECSVEIVDAETQVIDDAATGRDKPAASILHRIDDHADVIGGDERCRRDLHVAVNAFLRSRKTAEAELLRVPRARRRRIGAEHVHVPEIVMARSVQLDQHMIRAVDVGVEERAIAADHIADVGDRRGEARALGELLLIRRLHVLRAPADVPDAREQLARRRRVDFGEQQPGVAGPDCVAEAGERFFTRLESARVELDRRRRIGCVQMHVMEVSLRIRTERQREQQQRNGDIPHCRGQRNEECPHFSSRSRAPSRMRRSDARRRHRDTRASPSPADRPGCRCASR